MDFCSGQISGVKKPTHRPEMIGYAPPPQKKSSATPPRRSPSTMPRKRIKLNGSPREMHRKSPAASPQLRSCPDPAVVRDRQVRFPWSECPGQYSAEQKDSRDLDPGDSQMSSPC